MVGTQTARLQAATARPKQHQHQDTRVHTRYRTPACPAAAPDTRCVSTHRNLLCWDYAICQTKVGCRPECARRLSPEGLNLSPQLHISKCSCTTHTPPSQHQINRCVADAVRTGGCQMRLRSEACDTQLKNVQAPQPANLLGLTDPGSCIMTTLGMVHSSSSAGIKRSQSTRSNSHHTNQTGQWRMAVLASDNVQRSQ